MNDAFAIKVLSQMREAWRVILATLPPDAVERRRKYRREIAAQSCAVRKLTGK
jgi:hypothetical protein